MLRYKVDDPDNEYHGQVGIFQDMVVFVRGLSRYYLLMPDKKVLSFLSHQVNRLPRKVLFLDIDGVCNSADYMTSGRHVKGTMLGIDPFPAVLVKMIVQDTGCDVVLSSTWRLNENTRNAVREEVVDFIGVTPSFGGRDRGYEIEAWLEANPDVGVYAILDDDMDMLAYQAPNFFKTTWKEGLTREIAQAVTEHFNGN